MEGDQDLRTVVREFKASVSADLTGMHRRLDQFSDEVRDRFRTLETAVMHELRDLSQRTDARADRIEARLDGIEPRLDAIDDRLDSIDDRLDGIDTHLDSMAAAIARIEDALAGGSDN